MLSVTVSDALYIHDPADPTGPTVVYPFSQEETDLWYDRSNIMLQTANGRSFPLVPKTYLGKPYSFNLHDMAVAMYAEMKESPEEEAERKEEDKRRKERNKAKRAKK